MKNNLFNNKKWLALVIFFLPAIAFAKTALTDVNVENTLSSARITLKFTEIPKQHVFSLSNPERIVIDLTDTQLKKNLKEIHIPSVSIKNIRSGYPKPATLRLVFETDSLKQVKSSFQDNELIVDAYFFPQKTKNSEKNPAPIKSASVKREIVVVVDAGHGGKDTGAIGKLGTREKDVVLAIAKQLAHLINKQPHMRAELTRDGDYFVTLRNRLNMAHKNKATLFIAIHADSYFDNSANGASVYSLSRRGATSEAARWLAKSENYSELEGVDLSDLETKDTLVRSVLIDLAQTATITDSVRLGTALLDALDDMTKLHRSRVEQAPFVVLKSPEFPSVLVETGFISNQHEELHLRDPQYQNKIAEAIYTGIHQYLKKYS